MRMSKQVVATALLGVLGLGAGGYYVWESADTQDASPFGAGRPAKSAAHSDGTSAVDRLYHPPQQASSSPSSSPQQEELISGPILGSYARPDSILIEHERVEQLTDILDSSAEPGQKVQALEALGRLRPNGRTLRACAQALAAPEPAVRQTAIHILLMWNDPAAIPIVHFLLRQDPVNEAFQQAADEVLVGLGDTAHSS